MDPKLVGVGLSLIQALMGAGNNESTRILIREELKKSQSRENSEMLKQMLSTLEQKHAANLQELNLEKERYKMEAEFLRKQLEDSKKEKKSAERTDKMKEILDHLSGLSLQKQTPHKNQKKKEYSPQSCSSQSNSSGNTLPWMDSPKGNFQSTTRGRGNHGRGNYHSNYAQKNQNSNTDTNYQQKQFQQFPNAQQNPYFPQQQSFSPTQGLMPNPYLLTNPNLLLNQNLQHNPTFQPNQDYPQNQSVPQHPNFQQKQNFQQHRGQHSNRFRGRGQRGNSRGGRGRSSSLGRDQAQMNQASGNIEHHTASFHVQVSKMGPSCMSSENISRPSDVSSQRGRGNSRGHGRGRGRGNMHGAQSEVKKNRKKQTEGSGDQWVHVPRDKQKNNEGDPEENCVVS